MVRNVKGESCILLVTTQPPSVPYLVTQDLEPLLFVPLEPSSPLEEASNITTNWLYYEHVLSHFIFLKSNNEIPIRIFL